MLQTLIAANARIAGRHAGTLVEVSLAPCEGGMEYHLAFDGSVLSRQLSLHVYQSAGNEALFRLRLKLRHSDARLSFRTHPRATALSFQVNRERLVEARRLGLEITPVGPFGPIERYGLIIGAMKSGTSTLYTYAADHPQACPNAIGKEPQYFTSDNFDADQKVYDSQYCFDPERHRIAIEASTNYTKFPAFSRAAERMARYRGRFRLVYVLRNPVDRIESHIAHSIAAGRLTLASVEDTIARNEFSEQFANTISVSRYAEQLDQYLPVFARDDLLLVDLDELANDPVAVSGRLFAFFEIDPLPRLQLRGIRNPRKSRNGSERFRLPPQTRSKLRRELAPDVKRLVSEHGFTQAEKWDIA